MEHFESGLGYDPIATFLGKVVVEDPNENARYDVPRSVDGLRTLSRIYAWASVLELSASLLASDDDAQEGNTNDSGLQPEERLQVAAWRAVALLQTRQEERAADMLRQLGDLSDDNLALFFEAHSELYPGRAGSFVPFLLKAVAADAAARLSHDAIEHVYALKRKCSAAAAASASAAAGSSQSEAEAQLWRAREAQLLSTLAVLHGRAGQHDAAVDVARELVRQQGTTARALYVYARVLLGVGDVTGARRAVTRAAALCDDTPGLRLAHEAMLLAADGRFEDAAARYDAAAHLAPEMSALAANNAAICLLHLGRCDEALDRLENCLRQDPVNALDEGVVVNLATLYELTSPDTAKSKKATLKKLASKYARQGFDLDVITIN